MKNVACLLCIVSLLAFTSCASMKSKSKTAAGTLSSGELKWRISKTVEMQYLCYLPKDYDPKNGQRWPLLLFLHGSGERGTNLQSVAIHGPLNLVKQGREFPFIIVAPQCPEGQDWSNEPLLALLDHITKKFAVDMNRVYLTGLSMGGYGTWRLAFAHPEKFAAIVPICGGGSLIDVILEGDNKAQTLKYKDLPVWAFHGGKDHVVPPDESERLVKLLKKLGVKEVKLTIYPDANHNSWTETYNNPEIYEWMLKHELHR
jgi:predicted peptidase